MKQLARSLVALAMALLLLVPASPASGDTEGKTFDSLQHMMSQLAVGPMSVPNPQNGHFGVGITECPHAGEPSDKSPKPLDRHRPDRVEQLSKGGDDVRVNQDYSCMPQNETSIAVNPTNPKNVLAGQNDYRLGWGTSGFDASTDNGSHWFDGIKSFPTAGTPLLSPVLLSDDHLDGGGDPAIVFDRDGVTYYAEIHFERERDDNGIFVSRSTNGGFTWSRPCVVRLRDARCGGVGDPRTPGDGIVQFDEDLDGTGPAPARAFNDKEYIAAGPRPAGVGAVCFTPGFVDSTTGEVSGKRAIQAGEPGCPESRIGPDRVYVTWTRFDNVNVLQGTIELSFSDDRGRSWSPRRTINGSAAFCTVALPPRQCNANQFSSPTVSPDTGFLYVGFENFNTEEENQYLVVRSRDGGATFEGPFFATFIFDINYPDSGDERQDCDMRGQQDGRNVLTNSCFRMFSAANMVVDKRSGAFADDLYMVLSDNRNGTEASTNTDVFFFKSTDGGTTWLGPTRVNDDPSMPPADRSCQVDEPNCAAVLGNDNYYPWVDVSLRGDINIGFYDRRLDTTSTLGEWPASRAAPNGRVGNYLSWYWGAICAVTTTAEVTPASPSIPAAAQQCLAPGAAIIFEEGGALLPPEPPGPDPVPGQGPMYLGPFKNFTLSDVPQNDDYAFRAGIFSGDYSNVAVGPDGTAYAVWTDARNGRGSGTGGTNVNQQPGRNPACEQSDIFMDSYSAQSGGTARRPPSIDVINAFSVTPCPTDMREMSSP